MATVNHYLKYDNKAAEMNITIKFRIQVLLMMSYIYHDKIQLQTFE